MADNETLDTEPSSAEEAAARPADVLLNVVEFIQRWGRPLVPVLVLPVLIGLFTAFESRFISITNLNVMLTQAGPLLMISLGATLVVLMGSIDLSVGAIAALSAAAAAVLISDHGWGTAGFILTIFIGMALGGVNAFCSILLKLRRSS